MNRPLEDAAKIAVFRIVQEALNNVLKHSEAKHASVQLEFAEKGIRLSVRDDGCGFDLDKIRVNPILQPPFARAGRHAGTRCPAGRHSGRSIAARSGNAGGSVRSVSC